MREASQTVLRLKYFSGQILFRRLAQWALLLACAGLLSACFTFKPPRCRVAGCRTEMIHTHEGKEYRGEPFWKPNQNPRIGQKRGIRHDPATKNPDTKLHRKR